MKYFKITDTSELKYAPQLINWYGKFDVRDIRLKSYPKLPKKEIFLISPSEKTIFTDFILFPFLLVSQKVIDVIKMYRELCFYREIILLDQVNGQSAIYYLPVFNENNQLRIIEKVYDNGESRQGTIVFEEKVEINKNIFWSRDSLKRHTIISLDLAESLLRRNVIGLGIEEIELFMKD